MKLRHWLILLFATAMVLIPVIRAENPHWTARYSRFAAGRPPAGFDQRAREFFEGTVIRNVKLDADTLRDAIPKLQSLVRGSGTEWGLSVIITEADYAGFSKPLHVEATNLTLATLIDKLAEQGDFYWDFSAGKLTFLPKRKR